MAALCLARAGRSVLLVEREPSAHHKVCGEFLSPEAVAYLRHGGVDPLALGASPICRLRILIGARDMENDLPFTALSLSRSRLDAALLERACDAGAEVQCGVAVSRLQRAPDGWNVLCADGRSFAARDVFLATGKHDLHGWARTAGAQNDLVGFKMHWQLEPRQMQALRGVMALFLFPEGYGGLSLVEGGLANLCFVVRRAAMRRCQGWTGLLAEIVRGNERIAGCLGQAQPLWERPLAISPIPYGYLAGPDDGLWRVGDQAAVIPSFTGDGMSIALHSAALAAEMYLAGASVETYGDALRAQLRPGMRLATLVSRTIVSRIGRSAAPAALTVCPPLIRWIAEGTRIPGHALSSMALS
jgi:flavin-dependent dehydrogenase